MTPTVVVLVLVAAALHAGWNALLKINEERLAIMALLNASSAAISLIAVPFLPLPPVASWPYVLGSVVLHAGYMFFLLHAYRHGDLGHVYPIARGTAPLLVAVLSALLIGEHLGWAAWIGMLVITGGVISIAFRGRVPLREEPRPLIYALITAAFIGAYTIVDGSGARVSGVPVSYTAWLFLLDGVPISLLALWHYGHGSPDIVRRNGLTGFAAGAMSLAAYGLVIWALSKAPMGPVAALRETSVVLAALLGTVFLKEGQAPWRIAAAAIVACGVIVLRI